MHALLILRFLNVFQSIDLWKILFFLLLLQILCFPSEWVEVGRKEPPKARMLIHSSVHPFHLFVVKMSGFGLLKLFNCMGKAAWVGCILIEVIVLAWGGCTNVDDYDRFSVPLPFSTRPSSPRCQHLSCCTQWSFPSLLTASSRRQWTITAALCSIELEVARKATE